MKFLILLFTATAHLLIGNLLLLINELTWFYCLFQDKADGRCITTRHVSGFGNRGGGFITNDRDIDNLYYNNERCGWEIAVPPGATISFHFIEMELESPGKIIFL